MSSREREITKIRKRKPAPSDTSKETKTGEKRF